MDPLGTDTGESVVIAPGALLGERYRLESRLGSGGMAAVWLAVDERLDREVAVKVLSDIIAGDPQYLARFQREAHTAASLKHPNLVGIWDYGAGARPYLVMEYVEGGDLAERIESGEVPPIEDLARDLLEALRHMHAAGVLHRDIKPHNVLVAEDGTARLTDFGIAQPAGATALTGTGLVIGTESYIAPEVRQGEPASERSDLFALGVVLADVAGDRAPTAVRDLAERLRRSSAGSPAGIGRGSAEHARALARATGHGRADDALRGHCVRANDRRTAGDGNAAGAGSAAAAAVHPDSDRRFEHDAPPPPPSRAARGGRDRSRGRGRLGAGLGRRQRRAETAQAGRRAPPPPDSGQGSENSGEGSGNGGGGAAPVEEEPAPETETTTEEPVADVTTDGAALNDEGKSLIDAGQPEEAVPVLEEAVAALEGSGDELTYNYALFNLAQALRQSGRPEEAIPLLEQRLDYPDQTEAVQAELDAALAEAGRERVGGRLARVAPAGRIRSRQVVRSAGGEH